MIKLINIHICKTVVRPVAPPISIIYPTTDSCYCTPPSFKRHNLVNIRFIYLEISGNIAEGMLSLQI